jgi:hypothetical protein
VEFSMAIQKEFDLPDLAEDDVASLVRALFVDGVLCHRICQCRVGGGLEGGSCRYPIRMSGASHPPPGPRLSPPPLPPLFLSLFHTHTHEQKTVADVVALVEKTKA